MKLGLLSAPGVVLSVDPAIHSRTMGYIVEIEPPGLFLPTSLSKKIEQWVLEEELEFDVLQQLAVL